LLDSSNTPKSKQQEKDEPRINYYYTRHKTVQSLRGPQVSALPTRLRSRKPLYRINHDTCLPTIPRHPFPKWPASLRLAIPNACGHTTLPQQQTQPMAPGTLSFFAKTRLQEAPKRSHGHAYYSVKRSLGAWLSKGGGLVFFRRGVGTAPGVGCGAVPWNGGRRVAWLRWNMLRLQH
jgi:hypothetical protein